MKKAVILLIALLSIGLSSVEAGEIKDTVLKEFVSNLLKSKSNFIEYMKSQNLVDCKNFLKMVDENPSIKIEIDTTYMSKNWDRYDIVRYDTLYWVNKKQNLLSITIDNSNRDYIQIDFILNDNDSSKKLYEFEGFWNSKKLDYEDTICKIAENFINELIESDDDYIEFLQTNELVNCSDYLKKLEKNQWQEAIEYFIDFLDNDYNMYSCLYSRSYKESMIYDALDVGIISERKMLIFSFLYQTNSDINNKKALILDAMYVYHPQDIEFEDE